MPEETGLRLTCPVCQRTVLVRPAQLGKRVRCLRCQQVFTPQRPRPEGAGATATEPDEHHVAAEAQELLPPRGARRHRLQAEFPRSRDLVFRAAVQALRSLQADLLQRNAADAVVSFRLLAPRGVMVTFELAVYDHTPGRAAAEIHAGTPIAAADFDALCEPLVTEIGKYLLFAQEPGASPATRRLPPAAPARRYRDKAADHESSGGGLASAALVLGAAGLVAWCIPLLGAPVNLLGILLGVLGMKPPHRNLAIVGTMLAAIGLALSLVNAILGALLELQRG